MSYPLRAEGLTKTFSGKKALNRVTFSVPEGSVFGLVGPNGSGKTTAIKTLLNIYYPTSGRAEVLGVESRHLGPAQLGQIGYVSEDQRLPSRMKTAHFFSYCKAFYPMWSDEDLQELLSRFDLPLDRCLSHLSRGMRVKAMLASSLAYRPRLLFLDEPFGGLDVLVRDQVIETILDRTPECTIFIASHELLPGGLHHSQLARLFTLGLASATYFKTVGGGRGRDIVGPALAALFQSFAYFLLAAIGVAGAAAYLVSQDPSEHYFPWIPPDTLRTAVSLIAIAVGAAIIIAVQYARRRAGPSRAIGLVTAAAATLFFLCLPSTLLLRVKAAASPVHALLSMQFPASGRSSGGVYVAKIRSDTADVEIPITLSGLPDGLAVRPVELSLDIHTHDSHLHITEQATAISPIRNGPSVLSLHMLRFMLEKLKNEKVDIDGTYPPGFIKEARRSG